MNEKRNSANVTYGVRIDNEYETAIDVTVSGGPAAYNTARQIAQAVAKINPGAVVAVLRDGRVTERYAGERIAAVVVRRIRGRRRTPLASS